MRHRCSGLLLTVGWFVTDGSGQRIRPFFKDTDGRDTLSRNTMTNHPSLRNKPEEQRSDLHIGKILKSRYSVC